MPYKRAQRTVAASPKRSPSPMMTRGRRIKAELPDAVEDTPVYEGRYLRSRATKTPSSAETNQSKISEVTTPSTSFITTRTNKNISKQKSPVRASASAVKRRGRPPKAGTAKKQKKTDGLAIKKYEYLDDDEEEEDLEESEDQEEDEFQADDLEESEEEEKIIESEGEEFTASHVKKSTRRKVTIAKAEIPLEHSRLKLSGDNKRFKFRSSACQNSKTSQFNVQEYLATVKNSRDMFYSILAEDGCIPELLTGDEAAYTNSVPDSENLTKWLDRSSVSFVVRSDFTKKSKHTVAVKIPPPLSLKAEISVSIFTSASFEFTLEKLKHEMNSFLVDAMMKSPKLMTNKKVYETLKEISDDKSSRNQRIQALFCGGPILAIKAAPRRAFDGFEVVAITTVANEITWEHEPGMSSYIQFWKFNTFDSKENASIWFLLRVENVGTIADMAWCPFFHEEILRKTSTENINFDLNLLGYLAITTDVGKILIFKINKEIELSSDSPPIVVSSPSFVLKHPVVFIDDPNAPEKEVTKRFSKRAKKSELSDLDESAADFVPLLDEQQLEDIANIVTGALNDTNLNPIENDEEQNIEEVIMEEPAQTPKKKKRNRKPKNKAAESILEAENDNVVDENADEPGPSSQLMEEDNETVNPIKKQIIEVEEAPFICIDWSPFLKCKDILVVSRTGWVLIYDLTNPREAKDGIYDLSWESQPTSARWVTKETIAIGFQSRVIMYYDITTKEKLFQDNASRAVGTLVNTQPVIFPGAFSFDSVRVIPEDRTGQYSVGVYQVLNRTDFSGLVVPLPNKHQGQCFDLAACEMSGLLATVGSDGRLVESMNGRITCRGSKDDSACFVHRPVLQLVRHKNDGKHTNKEEFELSREESEKRRLETVDILAAEPLISHDKVNSSTWLEIRVGDATLTDQESHSKSSVFVERITFDRRIESLTRLEFSRLSPGLAITGGEAGIVFIVPTSL